MYFICCSYSQTTLISSGLTCKLRSGALWRRRHSGVQNDANSARAAAAQGHEPHAGHEGTYHPVRRAGATITLHSALHTILDSNICKFFKHPLKSIKTPQDYSAIFSVTSALIIRSFGLENIFFSSCFNSLA